MNNMSKTSEHIEVGSSEELVVVPWSDFPWRKAIGELLHISVYMMFAAMMCVACSSKFFWNELASVVGNVIAHLLLSVLLISAVLCIIRHKFALSLPREENVFDEADK